MHLLSVFSLRNRALIALVTIVVAVFGGVALSSLKQELIPSVEFPQVAIVSAYPGATPEVVSNDVSTKIEQAIQVVPDLESTSATSSTGQSVVSASFQYGSNLASAEDKIQTAVNALSLPDSVQTQIVTGSFDDLPVLQVAVSASGNQEQLVDRLQASAIPDLEKLDGVRQADVFGNPGRRVVITPNQDELAARGLSQTAISDALDDNGTLIPGGTLTEDGSTLSVQTGERIASLKDIRDLPLTRLIVGVEARRRGPAPRARRPAAVPRAVPPPVPVRLPPARPVRRRRVARPRPPRPTARRPAARPPRPPPPTPRSATSPPSRSRSPRAPRSAA